MKNKRDKTLKIRCDDDLIKAIDLLRSYCIDKPSTADIIYRAVASDLRKSYHSAEPEVWALIESLHKQVEITVTRKKTNGK